ncbi:MAG: hypothetical protein NW201_07630 [Gemmatimonadales bacterium]|nr:hypothetical protein [Gemmatimonadales bacterium]
MRSSLLRLAIAAALVLAARPLVAQQPELTGTWRVDANRKTKDGPREVVIRADSSASWGKETVRWRLPKPGEIRIVVGGEWETYRLKLKKDQLTLSGGDLTEAITLRRIGVATPRPDSVKIPDDPDASGN